MGAMASKSPATQGFMEHFIPVNNKKHKSSTLLPPLWEETTVTLQRASNVEKVSMVWRHHFTQRSRRSLQALVHIHQSGTHSSHRHPVCPCAPLRGRSRGSNGIIWNPKRKRNITVRYSSNDPLNRTTMYLLWLYWCNWMICRQWLYV